MESPMTAGSNIRDLAIGYHQKGEFREAIKAYRIAILLFPRDTVLSFNLGNLFRSIDQPQMAISCYELVLKIKGDDLATLYNLAPLYRSGGEHQKAILCYQKILHIDPHHTTAQYFLDALLGHCPPRSPDSYVQELFDRYAPTFDQHITGALAYRGPHLLRQLLFDYIPAPRRFYQAVDLGCGTGLVAEELDLLSRQWIGVDISTAMLKQATDKKIYTELIASEICQYLTTAREVPLIVAADVVPYFGDLSSLFKAACKLCELEAAFSSAPRREPRT